jgi:hypothetical protein
MKNILKSFLVVLLIVCVAEAQVIHTLRNVYIQLGTSGTTLTGTTGNSGSVQQAGTVSTTSGSALCTDSAKNSTTSGCGFTLVSLGKSTSVCTTGSSAESTCTTVVTISPTQPDTNYIATCGGISATNFPFMNSLVKSTVAVSVTIVNGTASEAMASTWAELDCVAIHP